MRAFNESLRLLAESVYAQAHIEWVCLCLWSTTTVTLPTNNTQFMRFWNNKSVYIDRYSMGITHASMPI